MNGLNLNFDCLLAGYVFSISVSCYLRLKVCISSVWNVQFEYNMNVDICIYSKDFDKEENIANGGYSGKVFLDGLSSGSSFDDIYSALDRIVKDGDSVSHLYYDYLSNDMQFHKMIF